MEIRIKVDTKPKGCEYTKAGEIVKVSPEEGARLVYLGFAEEVKPVKKASKKK